MLVRDGIGAVFKQSCEFSLIRIFDESFLGNNSSNLKKSSSILRTT